MLMKLGLLHAVWLMRLGLLYAVWHVGERRTKHRLQMHRVRGVGVVVCRHHTVATVGAALHKTNTIVVIPLPSLGLAVVVRLLLVHLRRVAVSSCAKGRKSMPPLLPV